MCAGGPISGFLKSDSSPSRSFGPSAKKSPWSCSRLISNRIPCAPLNCFLIAIGFLAVPAFAAPALSAAEIGLPRTWIDAGAEW